MNHCYIIYFSLFKLFGTFSSTIKQGYPGGVVRIALMFFPSVMQGSKQLFRTLSGTKSHFTIFWYKHLHTWCKKDIYLLGCPFQWLY